MRFSPRHPLSSTRTTVAQRALAASAAILSAVALSACGTPDRSPMGGDHDGMMSPRASTPSATASSTTPAAGGSATTVAPSAHNQADIDFAAGMVPHHEQALDMADMALAHGRTDDFLALAKAIKAAQKPEIDLMTGWLVSWGQEVPDATGHGGHGGMGMMSQQDLDDLGQMRGSGFEGMWLTMMIEHHEGAIEMSQTELKEGSSPEAKELAASIIKSQSAEITQMKAMLAERAN